MEHARLSPSSSSRWLSCTASVEIGERYQDTTNSAAEWGSNVHYMGEQLLLGQGISVGDTLTEKDRPPFAVDKEMLDCAEEYVDYVNAFITPNTDAIMIEERFDLSVIAPEQFGTSDATVLNGTHLHVFDLKTGRGIVYAENNTQLMMYAVGAVEELETYGETIETVTLHIVQTRVHHIDTWELSYEDLMKFKDYAHKQAKAILTGETTFNPNAKACQWCPHQVSCEALKAHVDETVSSGFDNIEDIEGQADIIDVKHIASILKNKELIIGFIKAVEERALEVMQSGTEIEGFKVVEAKTNRKWIDEAEVAKYLNRKIKPADLWVKKLIPMTKILKLRPKDKGLEAMLIKPEGKPTLAPLSDKRPPLSAVVDGFDEC